MRSLVLGFFFCGCALSLSSDMATFLLIFKACTLLLVGVSLNFAGSLQTWAGHLLMPLVELPTPSMPLSSAGFWPCVVTLYAPKVVWVDHQHGELLPNQGENKKTLPQGTNLWSWGTIHNDVSVMFNSHFYTPISWSQFTDRLLISCKCKYIHICEGDSRITISIMVACDMASQNRLCMGPARFQTQPPSHSVC